MLFTLLLSILSLSNAQMSLGSQILVGSQRDDHDCVTDGGYQWCETTQSCIRPWMVHCESLSVPIPTPINIIDNNVEVDFCDNSPNQLCRMACELPMCQEGECAIRKGNCCEYTCQSIVYPTPLPQPITTLPHPTDNNIPSNCLSWYDGCNTCQVLNGHVEACTLMMCFTQGQPECRTYNLINNCRTDLDCDSEHFCRPLSDNYNGEKHCVEYSHEGESCGGFVMPNYINRCHPSLECVNTMGPMIADAHGTCRNLCDEGEQRDQYGNCIDSGCDTWFDGCNTLNYVNGQYTSTDRYCNTLEQARCVSETVNLEINDICYRFCEDGSQSFINMKDLCPQGSNCVPSITTSYVSFDTCNVRAWRCSYNAITLETNDGH